MNEKCRICITQNKEVDCYNCVTEYNQKSKKELNKMLNLIGFGVITIISFTSINNILIHYYPNTEFGLSFGFWGLVLCFIIYLLPIKRKKKK